MPVSRANIPVKARLDALRTGFADLAYDLERQGRRDAADVVMMLDARVRAMAEEITAENTGDDANGLACFRSGFMPTNNLRCRG